MRFQEYRKEDEASDAIKEYKNHHSLRVELARNNETNKKPTDCFHCHQEGHWYKLKIFLF